MKRVPSPANILNLKGFLMINSMLSLQAPQKLLPFKAIYKLKTFD